MVILIPILHLITIKLTLTTILLKTILINKLKMIFYLLVPIINFILIINAIKVYKTIFKKPMGCFSILSKNKSKNLKKLKKLNI